MVSQLPHENIQRSLREQSQFRADTQGVDALAKQPVLAEVSLHDPIPWIGREELSLLELEVEIDVPLQGHPCLQAGVSVSRLPRLERVLQ